MPRFAPTAAALAIVLVCGSAPALAQKKGDTYPSRPIRMIVPFVPGGGTDIVARGLAQKLYEQMGQTIVVDNRPGAGGTIGAETTVRAAPDGYTIIMVSGSYGTNAALYKLPYDPINDIKPVSLIGESGFMVSLNNTVPIRSLKDLIAYAKANPGKLNYGSTGTGGITHLSTELFDLMAGTKMTHIPYKGTGGAITDLLGGQIQLIFGSMPSMVPLAKSGRVRGIGVTTAKRNAAMPDVPAIAEVLPGYESVLWYGAWGPKNLPDPIVKRLNAEFARALAAPDVRERLAGEGIEIAGGPPEQLRDILKREIPKWIDVVKRANVKISS